MRIWQTDSTRDVQYILRRGTRCPRLKLSKLKEIGKKRKKEIQVEEVGEKERERERLKKNMHYNIEERI